MGLYLDYDKYENVFYSNLYLEDYSLVVKTPIVKGSIIPETPDDNKVVVEKFDLAKYVYLLSHE